MELIGLRYRNVSTNYDLQQLLLGIKWERAHTNKDNMLALELAMEHLELIADY